MAKRSRDTALENALAEHKECTQQLLCCLDQQTKLRAMESRNKTQEVELAGLEEKISVLMIAQETCRNVIAQNAAPTKENDKIFSYVDREFIEKVTGTNLDWRPWKIICTIMSSRQQISKSFLNRIQLPLLCARRLAVEQFLVCFCEQL
jgi:hypothetical protein